MRIITLSLLWLFIIGSAIKGTRVEAYVPYPPTPLPEVLNRLRELGRQNQQKYGTGNIVSKTPTRISDKPTLTPTIKPSPTSIPTPTMIGKVTTNTPAPARNNWWAGLWQKLVSLWIKPKTTRVQVSVPTMTPSPTVIPPLEISPETLWETGFDIWVKTKDYSNASEYYKKALSIDPNYVPAMASYGYMLGAFYNRFDEGESMLIQAMTLDPNWAYAPYNLGLLYDISGKKEKGIYWLQYTVDHFSNHPDIEWFKSHLKVAKE